jgi:predicted DNA-binding transcriptional regulator AlpA
MVTKKPRPKKPFPKPPKPVPVPGPSAPTGPIKFLSKKQVLEKVGVSHVTLREYIKLGLFPPPRVLGPGNGSRSKIGWIEFEVDTHINNLPKRLPKGFKAPEAES